MSISEWLTTFAADMVGFAVSAALLAAYHLYLRIRVRHNPAYTVQAVNRMARTAWVKRIMKEKEGILAVQTLRNSTMAATFLASTAVLLIIGVLTLSEQGEKLGSAFHAFNIFGARHAQLWMGKLLFLLLDLFVAFFAFSMSIRVYNHVGYMISVPIGSGHKVISPAHVAVHLNRAGRFYSAGMRAYYFLVPLVFWLFGPHFMVVTTLVLIAVLYKIDRAPKTVEEDYS